METAVGNLIGMLIVVASLVAGPVWAQSGPNYGTPDPQGSVEDLDDPQPEECQFYMALPMEDATEAPEDRAQCWTESDVSQISGHTSSCDAKADINCLLGKVEDVISLDPAAAVTVSASPRVCQQMEGKKRHPLYGARYSRVTCRPE